MTEEREDARGALQECIYRVHRALVGGGKSRRVVFLLGEHRLLSVREGDDKLIDPNDVLGIYDGSTTLKQFTDDVEWMAGRRWAQRVFDMVPRGGA